MYTHTRRYHRVKCKPFRHWKVCIVWKQGTPIDLLVAKILFPYFLRNWCLVHNSPTISTSMIPINPNFLDKPRCFLRCQTHGFLMPNLDVLGLVDGLVANHLASKASRWVEGLAASPWKGPHITGPVRQMTPCIWIHKTNEPLGYLKSIHQHSQNRQSKGVVAVRVCVCVNPHVAMAYYTYIIFYYIHLTHAIMDMHMCVIIYACCIYANACECPYDHMQLHMQWRKWTLRPWVSQWPLLPKWCRQGAVWGGMGTFTRITPWAQPKVWPNSHPWEQLRSSETFMTHSPRPKHTKTLPGSVTWTGTGTVWYCGGLATGTGTKRCSWTILLLRMKTGVDWEVSKMMLPSSCKMSQIKDPISYTIRFMLHVY